MFLWCITIPRERLQTAAITGLEGDGDSFSHAASPQVTGAWISDLAAPFGRPNWSARFPSGPNRTFESWKGFPPELETCGPAPISVCRCLASMRIWASWRRISSLISVADPPRAADAGRLPKGSPQIRAPPGLESPRLRSSRACRPAVATEAVINDRRAVRFRGRMRVAVDGGSNPHRAHIQAIGRDAAGRPCKSARNALSNNAVDRRWRIRARCHFKRNLIGSSLHDVRSSSTFCSSEKSRKGVDVLTPPVDAPLTTNVTSVKVHITLLRGFLTVRCRSGCQHCHAVYGATTLRSNFSPSIGSSFFC